MTLNRYAIPLLAAVLLFLGGCDAGDAPPEGEAARAVPEADDLAPQPGALAPINQSDVRGSATVVREQGSLRLVVEGEGLEPGSRYSAHVHEGRCSEGGPVRLPMGHMTASQEGTGSVRMQVGEDRLSSELDYFIQIYAPDDRPVACANIDPEG
jgi:hypothetical protein